MIGEGLPQLTASLLHADSIATSKDPASGDSMPRGKMWGMYGNNGVQWRRAKMREYVVYAIIKSEGGGLLRSA